MSLLVRDALSAILTCDRGVPESNAGGRYALAVRFRALCAHRPLLATFELCDRRVRKDRAMLV